FRELCGQVQRQVAGAAAEFDDVARFGWQLEQQRLGHLVVVRYGAADQRVVLRDSICEEFCCGLARGVVPGAHVCSAQAGVESLSPMIPATNSAMLSNRGREALSPRRAIPRIAVPTAPMPTQTAYPVPAGRVRSAIPSSNMLAAIAATVPTL